jgi:hypothetical protein
VAAWRMGSCHTAWPSSTSEAPSWAPPGPRVGDGLGGRGRPTSGGEVSDGPRPDSRIRLSGSGLALTAWLEVDRGTERIRSGGRLVLAISTLPEHLADRLVTIERLGASRPHRPRQRLSRGIG